MANAACKWIWEMWKIDQKWSYDFKVKKPITFKGSRCYCYWNGLHGLVKIGPTLGSENLIRCKKLQLFEWLKLQLLLAKFLGSLNPKSFGQSIVVS